VTYLRFDEQGFHILVGEEPHTLPVDTLVVCAGQEPLRELYDTLTTMGVKAHLIGGAFEAAELDAQRAIKQASELAATL
jgi:2,4-dienoyl-CoA reductase (NADPH2)